MVRAEQNISCSLILLIFKPNCTTKSYIQYNFYLLMRLVAAVLLVVVVVVVVVVIIVGIFFL